MNNSVSNHAEHPRIRRRIILVSLISSLFILAFKFWGAWFTGSMALRSDAFEGLVNVMAAAFALGAEIFASQPADDEHPYGHGKIEYFSEAFEGGLISLAAVLIAGESIQRLLAGGSDIRAGWAVAISLMGGAANGMLGWYLVSRGRRYHSVIIEADGKHVLSDFWTSVVVALGLVLVAFTHLQWLDSFLALLLSFYLLSTGFKLVQSSSRSLLDAQDPLILEKVVNGLQRLRTDDLVSVHDLRILQSGRFKHVDVHLVFPEFYTVQKAHELSDFYEYELWKELGIEGEFHSHIDPCRKNYCEGCAVDPCPIRVKSFLRRADITIATAIQKEK